jgi:hypothetical protein
MCQRDVEALQREGTSIIEMQVILDTLHISNAERLASNFVTLKAKCLLTQVLEGIYEKECTRFCQHASCLEHQNTWLKQNDELSAFGCLSLNDVALLGKF